MKRLTIALSLFILLSSAGCIQGSSEATFIGDRDEDLCHGVYHVCQGQKGGCKLDNNRYLSGSFPGARKFLVETTHGDWKIKVLLFLKRRVSPGTETSISWYEPGCTDEYPYKLSKNSGKGDLFEQAGRNQVFEVENSVIEPGDHLVTIDSDATCDYLLRVEINPQ